MPITHAKVSAVADGGNASLVLPSDWNAAHVGGGTGWAAYAYPPTHSQTSAYTATLNMFTNVCFAVPIPLVAPMLLEAVSVRNLDTSGARAWEWRLYVQTANTGIGGAENTLSDVSGANG